MVDIGTFISLVDRKAVVMSSKGSLILQWRYICIALVLNFSHICYGDRTLCFLQVCFLQVCVPYDY